MIPYLIYVFSSKDVTTVLYIWISFAYCFPSIEKSFQFTKKSQLLHKGSKAHVNNHELSFTSLLVVQLTTRTGVNTQVGKMGVGDRKVFL